MCEQKGQRKTQTKKYLKQKKMLDFANVCLSYANLPYNVIFEETCCAIYMKRNKNKKK